MAVAVAVQLHLSDSKLQEMLVKCGDVQFYVTMDSAFLQSKRFQHEPRSPMICEVLRHPTSILCLPSLPLRRPTYLLAFGCLLSVVG